jgi:capsular polysaccharide biosynthesis protein
MRGIEPQPCVDMYGDLPFGLFALPDSTLRGEAGYIFTSDGTPILEQNADFLRKKRFLKPRLTEEHRHLRRHRNVDDLVSLTSRCDTGFFHWMMDSLPKVVIAEACGFTGSYLIPAPSAAPWAEESMTLLGISPTRLIHHTSLDTRARCLFIPTYFSGYNAHHNKPFMKLYRDTVRCAISKEDTNSGGRILIARKPETKVRRILNHEEVNKTAHDLGFRTVYFEDFSLREQLQQALSAEAMIGSHGSGLCHSLFMNEGSTLIELFPFTRKQSCDCYEALATIPPHYYHALESTHDREGDIVVPTTELRKLLQQTGGR